MDAAIALHNPPANIEQNFGDPWIHGDGTHGNGARNLKDPNITSFYHMTFYPESHEAGRAISKLFYLVQQSPYMTPQRFLQFLLQVGHDIKDTDTNGLDLFDLRRAMVGAVRPNEIGLQSHIMSHFDAMYNAMPPFTSPPVGVPPSTAPLAPPPVAVFTGGCATLPNGSRGSEWLVNWNKPTNAVNYAVTLTAQANGQVLDFDYFNNPPIFVDTNTDTLISVQACNSFNLCSAPGHTTAHHRTSCANF
jgi:hypothetical protein